MDHVIEFFLSEPKRLMSLGHSLVTVGAMIIIIGLIGNVATSSISAVHLIGAVSSPTPTLAQLYPNFWTWWISESFIGSVPALLIAATGICMTLLGRDLQRVYH